MVEDPDDEFADDNFDDDGVLYKALSTGQLHLSGRRPARLRDGFKQITHKKQQDLQPVIELIKWVNRPRDAEFAADLDDHVDVESFARYVALQNLLLNFDDMAGPGQNYYLWYDLETERSRSSRGTSTSRSAGSGAAGR